MKHFCGVAFFLYVSFAHAVDERFEAISNIDDRQATIVSVFARINGQPERVIASIDIKTGSISRLPSIQFSEEKVIALLSLKEGYILIAQWLQGGAEFPRVYFLGATAETAKKTESSKIQKSWQLIGSLMCQSFDRIQVIQAQLTVNCEADPERSQPAGERSIALPVRVSKKIKTALPIVAERSTSGATFRVKGPLFRWTRIETRIDDRAKPRNLSPQAVLYSR